MLVRLAGSRKQRGRLRVSEEKAITDANKVTPARLSPIERRAAELVCGASPKPRKNLIEVRACELAEAVLSEWFRREPVVHRGRPSGRSNGAYIDPEGSNGTIPISVREIVTIASPVIEEFAEARMRARATTAHQISEIQPPVFAALVAAVQLIKPVCSAATVERELRRSRTTDR